MTAQRRLLTLAACVLVVAGCGSDEVSSPSAGERPDATEPATEPADGPASTAVPSASSHPPAPSSSAPTPAPTSGTRIITADSAYGPMLYDAGGQPIYLFTAEPDADPACYGACADDWPPVLTDGPPRAATGVRAGLLGSVPRSDGRTQVTYAGHPLYFYAHEGAYEVLCHDVEEYGGTWLVVRPDGTPAAGG